MSEYVKGICIYCKSEVDIPTLNDGDMMQKVYLHVICPMCREATDTSDDRVYTNKSKSRKSRSKDMEE